MDLPKIKSVVLNQLTNTNGLYSLKLQNHIYGCFIVMEDIAQHTIDISGTTLSTPKFTFDYDKQFNEIGLRYGFAMDTKLTLDIFTPEYKATWLQYFKDIDIAQDINEVDKIEDCLIEVVQSLVKTEENFFISALETGSLPQEWIEKVLNLINPPIEKEIEVEKTAISTAVTEKPLAKRRLATTRRIGQKSTSNKKSLAKTRRHH
uniref:Uncharacterized protein n=1 Tax=viral metagenome TaxID=1070528 RepID=A0A6C0DT27_9ZZZZ